eukprot:TRINITY_DN7237_c0_g1_i1.p1 TRINITY_DN7237_c0_g1~~TRINITY_DN7237_c0_g1_i1.p1  ORF type:complete len:162 (+),score=51.31 TRINITY_DN7237_c0_g1_i1:84-569(+)
MFFFFLMIRRPPRSTQGVSSAASDVYKRQILDVPNQPGDWVLTNEETLRAMKLTEKKYEYTSSPESDKKHKQEHFFYESNKTRRRNSAFCPISRRNKTAKGSKKSKNQDIVISNQYVESLSLIHISEPTRPLYISYAVFCLKKKKKKNIHTNNTKKQSTYF